VKAHTHMTVSITIAADDERGKYCNKILIVCKTVQRRPHIGWIILRHVNIDCETTNIKDKMQIIIEMRGRIQVGFTETKLAH